MDPEFRAALATMRCSTSGGSGLMGGEQRCLRDAGFAAVAAHDGDDAPITADSDRMVLVVERPAART